MRALSPNEQTSYWLLVKTRTVLDKQKLTISNLEAIKKDAFEVTKKHFTLKKLVTFIMYLSISEKNGLESILNFEESCSEMTTIH